MASSAQYFNARNDYLGFGNPEIGWALEQTDGGYVIFQNAFENSSPRPRVGLITLMQDGSVAQQVSYGNAAINLFLGWMNTADRTWDNGYVFCGGQDSAQIDNALVWRFSANGDSLWAKRLFATSDTLSIGYGAVALPDSTILAVGAVYPPGVLSQVFLTKLDRWGVVLWSQLFGGAAHDRGRSIDVAADGSIYIGGETYGSPGPDSDDLVIKTDADGNLLWSDSPGSQYNDASARVAATQDNGVVYVGAFVEYELGSSPYTRLYGRRYSAAGGLVWENKYGPTRFVHELTAVKALPDGSFIASGTLMGPVFPHGTLLKIAANGDSLWQREYTHPSTLGGTDWHELRDVIPTDDGGYVACGVLLDTTQDVWVIKVDSFGCLVPNCQLWDNIAEQEIAVHVLLYPNPATDRLYISFRSQAAHNGTFTIFDSAGRSVRSFPVSSTALEIELDIRDLSPGLFTLRYADPPGTHWSGRFVKN